MFTMMFTPQVYVRIQSTLRSPSITTSMQQNPKVITTMWKVHESRPSANPEIATDCSKHNIWRSDCINCKILPKFEQFALPCRECISRLSAHHCALLNPKIFSSSSTSVAKYAQNFYYGRDKNEAKRMLHIHTSFLLQSTFNSMLCTWLTLNNGFTFKIKQKCCLSNTYEWRTIKLAQNYASLKNQYCRWNTKLQTFKTACT
jgi:hypothetical protein